MALATESAGLEQTRSPGNRRIGHHTLRAAAAPTGSYVDTDYARVQVGRILTLLFTATWASVTSYDYYVEWSFDGTNWFRSINSSASGATNTITANSNRFAISAAAKWADTMQVQAPYVRVALKANGVIGSETIAVECLHLTD